MINDRKDAAHTKTFEKWKKEEAKDAKDKFAKIANTREDHLTKTRKKEKDDDLNAHREGKQHHKDVEAATAEKEARMLKDAQDQHARAVRDENEWLNRRKSLQRSCDKAAREAWAHLDSMQ